MAKFICSKCGGKGPAPKVHEGPGIVSDSRVFYPLLKGVDRSGKCTTVSVPRCCGAPMKYTA